jgi:hypothetical protein
VNAAKAAAAARKMGAPAYSTVGVATSMLASAMKLA